MDSKVTTVSVDYLNRLYEKMDEMRAALSALSDFVSHYTELTDEHDGVGEPYFTLLHEEFHSVVEQARAALARLAEPGDY